MARRRMTVAGDLQLMMGAGKESVRGTRDRDTAHYSGDFDAMRVRRLAAKRGTAWRGLLKQSF